ncbi:MAG: extracellular solute-binding protein [Clostridia bacterium]|nr:extracellular solute-binding protein [Clostridia bacterium]
MFKPKTSLSLLAVLLLSLCLLALPAFAAGAKEIGSAEELAALMQSTQNLGSDYVLTKDIDLSQVAQRPIGSYDTPFTGSFDGQGHTISGINLRADFTAGLFGVIEDATVKNLTVKGKVVNDFFAENAETKDEEGRYPGTGGLAAIVLGGSTVENCTAEMTVTGPGNTGGMIGHIYNFSDKPVQVISCVNRSTVNSLLGNAGGLIGRIFVSGNGTLATVRASKNEADVTLESEDRCRVGGVIGYIRTLEGAVIVEDCENTGRVTGANSGAKNTNYPYAAGIVGRNEVAQGVTAAIRIVDCINTGDISSTQCAGGIAAYMSRSEPCTNSDSGIFGCLNTGSVDGYLCGAGILAYTENQCPASPRTVVQNCLNLAPVESVTNAAGIIARLKGVDIVSCVSLAAPHSASCAGGLAGKLAGELPCEIRDSYYLNTLETTLGEPSPLCTERGNTAVAADAIFAESNFPALTFSPAAWTIGKNGLTLSKFASVSPAIKVETTPAVTEPVETTAAVTETEPAAETVPAVTEAAVSPSETAAPAPADASAPASEPTANKGGGVSLLLILLICVAVLAAICAAFLLIKMRDSRLWIAPLALLCAALILLLLGGLNGWFSRSSADSTNTNTGVSAADESDPNTPDLPDPQTLDIAGDFRFLVAGNWAWNDFAAENEEGNVVETAIYRRNALIKEKYGVNIVNEDIVKYASNMGTGDGYRKIYTDYMAGDSNYDAAMIGTYDVATLAYNGYIQDLNQIEHLDLQKSYWDQKANEDLSLRGKMYYTTGDISLSDNRSTYTLFFSKAMAKDYGLADPYELVRTGNWTLETFGSMVKAVGSDDNQDGIYDKNDTFGLLTPTDTHLAILAAADERICRISDAGQLVLTFYNERIVNLYDKYLAIVGDHSHSYNYQYSYVTGKTGLDSSNEERIAMFNTGHALFYSHTMFYMDYLRDLESDFGILPYPKLDAEQENYGNLVSAWHSEFLCVPVINKDLDRTGIILEELAYQGKKMMTPAYYEKTLVGQYTRDEESAEMLDIIFSSLVFDVGAYYNVGTYKDQLGSIVRTGNSLTTIYETYRTIAETKIGQINEFFARELDD